MPPGPYQTARKEPAERPPPEKGLFPAMPGKGVNAHPKLVARPVPPEKAEDGPAPEELGIPGRSGLFLGPASDEPWRLFRMLSGGRRSLVLSGAHPARLRLRFGLDEAELVWLSAYAGSKEETLAPQTLEYELLGRTNRHFRSHRGSILLLDDLDYLASQCGFGPVVRFVKSVADSAAELRGTFLACADPEAFSARERAALSSLFDAVRKVPPAERAAPAVLSLQPAPGCLVVGRPEDAYRRLEAASRSGRALCITPNAPRKLKERYDLLRASFLWLSESAAGEGVIRPQEYAVEGQRAVLRHLRAGPGALVLLDGLESLRLYGDNAQLLRFIKGAIDAAAECGGAVLASLAPGALDPPAEASVRRRFETVLG